MDEFLVNWVPQTWQAPAGFPGSLTPAGMFVQDGANGLEVVLASARQKPSHADLRKAWFARRDKRVSPVLLVALNGQVEVVPRTTGTAQVLSVSQVLFSPTRPGELLAEAARRRIPR